MVLALSVAVVTGDMGSSMTDEREVVSDSSSNDLLPARPPVPCAPDPIDSSTVLIGAPPPLPLLMPPPAPVSVVGDPSGAGIIVLVNHLCPSTSRIVGREAGFLTRIDATRLDASVESTYK